MDILSPLLVKGDVELQLKLLQAFSALLLSYRSIHDHLLALTLKLCFQLQSSKVQVVGSTAAATVRQAVMVVFEKVAEEDKILDGIKDGGEDAAVAAPLAVARAEIPGQDSVTLFPSSSDAYKVLRDLNALAQEEEAEFLGLSTLSRTFTLELIESIFTNHASLIRSHPELLSSLRQSTCPLLLKALSEKPSFPSTLRYMRLLFVLLRQFSADLIVETEILLSILLRIIEGHSDAVGQLPQWQRILALEVTRTLCSDGQFLRHLWAWFDGRDDAQVKVFTRLVSVLRSTAFEDSAEFGAVSNSDVSTSTPVSARASVDRRSSGFGFLEAAAGVAGAMLTNTTGHGATATPDILGLSTVPKIQFVDQVEKVDAPSAPTGYLTLLSLQSLVHIAQSVSQHVLVSYSAIVNSQSRNKKEAPPAIGVDTLEAPLKSDLSNCKAMTQAASGHLESTFFGFLPAQIDDGLFSEILTAVRNWTNLCGVLKVNEARNRLLKDLSRLILSSEPRESTQSSLHERKLAELRVFTHISVYLSGSLEGHWQSVLTTLCAASCRIRLAGNITTSVVARQSDEDDGKSVGQPMTRHGIQPAAYQPGFSLASTPSDSRTGRPQLLAGLDLPTALSEIAKCFENSASLDDASLSYFLEACCNLCSSSLETGRKSGQSTTIGLISDTSVILTNLNIATVLNVRRLAFDNLEVGWNRVADTLQHIASDDGLTVSLRSQAAIVLTTLLRNAIEVDASPNSTAEGDKQLSDRIQSRVFVSLRFLCTLGPLTAGSLEVRRVGLDTMHAIVEKFGHALRHGWEVVFESSNAACQQAETGEPSSDSSSALRTQQALVKSAFAAVQIITNDLLTDLTLEQVGLNIRALQEFGNTGDLNIALTAISSLWTIVSELANRSSTTSGESVSGPVRELWLQVIGSYHVVASDQRPEVRDAAVAGLFRVLSSFGSLLDPQTWSKAFQEELFPLINETQTKIDMVKQKANVESTPISSPVAVRARRTSSVSKPAVPATQLAQAWESTLAATLNQLGGTIAQYLRSRVLHAPDFATIWSKFLSAVRTSFLAGPSKVSQASMSALKAVLSVKFEENSEDTRSAAGAWQEAWRTWVNVADAIESVPTNFSQANLVLLIEVFQAAYQGPVEAVELEAVPRLQAIGIYARSHDFTGDTDRPSPTQTASRQALLQLRHVPGLPSAQLKSIANSISLPFSAPSTGLGNVKAASSRARPTFVALHQAALQDCIKLCSDHSNDQELYTSGAMASVLAALALPIKLRYDCPPPGRLQNHQNQEHVGRALWQEATLSFCRIIALIGQHLSSHDDKLDSATVELLWHQILGVFRAACEADCAPSRQSTAEQKRQDQAFDILLLSSFEVHLWPVLGAHSTPSFIIEQFAVMLARASNMCDEAGGEVGDGLSGAQTDDRFATDSTIGTVLEAQATPREYFALSCLDLVVLLSSGGAQTLRLEQHRVAALTLPVLLRHAKGVLTSYTADSALQGGAPFPRVKDEEAYVLLSHLLDLRLLPQTMTIATSPDPSAALKGLYSDGDAPGAKTQAAPITIKSLIHGSSRAHLFLLHAQLLDIIALPGSKPSLAGTALSTPLVAPPLASLHTLEAPAGFAYPSRIGNANVLASRRLDREEPKRIPELARACLAFVSEALQS